MNAHSGEQRGDQSSDQSGVQWDARYGDLVPDVDDEDGLIPVIGIRMVIGVTNDGHDHFVYVVDSDGRPDNARAMHALKLVLRVLEDQEMQSYGLSVKRGEQQL